MWNCRNSLIVLRAKIVRILAKMVVVVVMVMAVVMVMVLTGIHCRILFKLVEVLGS